MPIARSLFGFNCHIVLICLWLHVMSKYRFTEFHKFSHLFTGHLKFLDVGSGGMGHASLCGGRDGS